MGLRIVWLFPFLSFFCGYFLMQQYYSFETVVPHLVGKSLHEAFICAQQRDIIIKLLEEQKSVECPPSTIIQQSPAAGSSVKRGQTIFVSVSKKRQEKVMPSFIGSTCAHGEQKAKQQMICLQHYHIETSVYPLGRVFAQYPDPGTPLQQKVTPIVYCACEKKRTVIMPSLKNVSLEKAQRALEKYPVTVHYLHDDTTHERSASCCVKDHRPLAGTIVTFENNKKAPSVYLQID